MSFERRNFLKLGTVGVAAAMATPTYAFNDDSTAKGKGSLQGDCSWIRLEGQLKAGHMVMEARAFEEGKDRTVIVHSKLDSVDLYSGMFSHDLESSIFAVFRDTDHSTSVLLSNTDNSKIARLLVWNDSAAPGVFEIDKDKFMDSENLNASLHNPQGTTVVDVLGKRKKPEFAWRELEAVFGDDPALNQFMRGDKSRHHPAKGNLLAFGCHIIMSLPSSTLALFWEAR